MKMPSKVNLNLSNSAAVKEIASRLAAGGASSTLNASVSSTSRSSSSLERIQMITPIRSSQELYYESAAILGVQTYLNILKLPYTIKQLPNAVDISPNGKLPVVRCGVDLVSEIEGVVHLMEKKGHSLLTEKLSTTQIADLKAYTSLVRNKLGRAMFYFDWIDEETFNHITKPRVGSPYAFPMNKFIPATLRKRAMSQLSLVDWGDDKTMAEVYYEVESCLTALSDRLGEKDPFFFGDSPTELDALVFGYLHTMLTTPNVINKTGEMVKVHENLLQFCIKMSCSFTAEPSNS